MCKSTTERGGLTLGLVLFCQSLFPHVALHHSWIGHTEEKLFLYSPDFMLIIRLLVLGKHVMFCNKKSSQIYHIKDESVYCVQKLILVYLQH